MKKLCILLLISSCTSFGRKEINQSISNCGNGTDFSMQTYGYDGRDIIYSSYTCIGQRDCCIPLKKLDSVKKAERAKAEVFMKAFKKVSK